MLIPRVIPSLLLIEESFVKTTKFRSPVYLGDPINVINLFNRFEVDEIALMDIRATLNNSGPNFALIEQLASECWVPLTYGGGLTSIEQLETLFKIGVEKAILNSALVKDLRFLKDASNRFGAQAIVAAIDVKRRFWGRYDVFIESGRTALRITPIERAKQLEEWGAGEIFLNTIHKDGTMKGYDLELIRAVSEAVNIPVIACGGASSRQDIPKPIFESHASAVSAGSIFVFKGQERGVCINFPERKQLEQLLQHEYR